MPLSKATPLRRIMENRMTRQNDSHYSSDCPADELLDLAIEAAQMGVWYWDGTPHNVACSEELSALRGLGRGHQYPSYEAYLEAIHPDDRERVRKAQAQALAQGQRYCEEYRIVWPDGTLRWVAEHGKRIGGTCRGSTMIIGVAYDVTPRRRLEVLLTNREATLRAVLEAATNGIVTTDHQWCIESCNPAAMRIFGYPRNALLGQSVLTLFAAPVAEEYKLYLAAYLVKGDMAFLTQGREISGQCHDGSGIPLALSVNEFEEVERHFTWIFRDLSGRQLVKEALGRSEEQLRMSLATARMGTWYWDIDNDTIICGKELEPVISVAQRGANPTYQVFLGAVHPEDRLRVDQSIKRAVEEQTDYMEEYRVSGPDGKIRWMVEAGSIYRDASGRPKYMTAVTCDITDRNRAQERLEQRQAEIAHAHRLASIGEMSTIVAHEINQPLTAILGYAENAVHRFPEVADNPALRDMLERTAALARRANAVVRNLRLLSRKQDGRRAPVDVNALIQQTIQLIRSDASKKGIGVVSELAPSVPFLEGNAVQIQQLILNLLLNAVDALESSLRTPKCVRVETSVASQEIELRISDTGPGIAPVILSRLFEPFVTTKEQGLGLGLSLCRSIVEAHGGHIVAQSTPDEGATFIIRLPLIDRDSNRVR
jgi:PAS domain S-box-containing protein